MRIHSPGLVTSNRMSTVWPVGTRSVLRTARCLLLSFAVPGSASPQPKCGPDARRTVADWLAMHLDGDQPELWVRSTPSLLLAVRTLLCSLRVSRLVG
jgi:hypothetical protein